MSLRRLFTRHDGGHIAIVFHVSKDWIKFSPDWDRLPFHSVLCTTRQKPAKERSRFALVYQTRNCAIILNAQNEIS